MIARVSILAALLGLASTAQAGWYPVFSNTYVHLKPGQEITLTVQGAWLSGISYYPFTPMTFASQDPAVATVTGSLQTSAPAEVHIVAGAPGTTRIDVLERAYMTFPTVPVIVVAEEELPVEIEVHGILAPGHTVVLHAATDEPDATFTWYWGALGDLYTWETGTGQDLTFTANWTGVYEYSVVMQSPRGAGAATAAFRVTQLPQRRRSIRHL
jgi:hypothetical protein